LYAIRSNFKDANEFLVNDFYIIVFGVGKIEKDQGEDYAKKKEHACSDAKQLNYSRHQKLYENTAKCLIQHEDLIFQNRSKKGISFLKKT
jgi:hypothetical protein